MSKSKPLMFFGTEKYSNVVLDKLLNSDVVISTVITKPDFKSGRGQKTTSPAVKITAESHNIKVLQPSNLDEISGYLTDNKCAFAILAAYGNILPKRTLDLFNGGILNIHPSLLPKWRGPSPVESTIVAGNTQTGVSIMKLSQKMDAGPVYIQQKVELTGTETKPELYKRLFELGAELLGAKLGEITAGQLQPKDQEEVKATYSKLLKKEDGMIDWSQPAEVYERQVRAYLGFPKSRTEVDGHQIVIIKARAASNQNDGALVMPCSAGFLEIQELIGPSGKTMTGAEFLRGYRG